MSNNEKPVQATPVVDAETKSPKTGMSVAEMEAEIKALELEAKRLEVQEKKANLQDLKERLDERELKRETKRQRSITNGATLKSLAANDEATQARCSHRKGGNGVEALTKGGDDSQYAVIKHQFCNGDIWVRCLRCGKTWKPPIESQYKTKEEYLKAYVDYQTALNFTTRNVMSGSVMYKFSDGGQYFREVMANSTLR